MGDKQGGVVYDVRLPQPHQKQAEIMASPAKRKVIRAGRRSGKTTIAAMIAIQAFLEGRRILYTAPTDDQVGRFWFLCKSILAQAITDGYLRKDETRHIIEVPEQLQGSPPDQRRIRGKTAYNADTLRGDYADLLIMDEYQLTDPDAWALVGAPMLLDNDGDAIFIYTTRRGAKGEHAKSLYRYAEGRMKEDPWRWAAFNFSSHDNPYLSRDALDEITGDMTDLAYRMEILAQDLDDDPYALWTREMIEAGREQFAPRLDRVVVGVDPPGSTRTECGIIVAGIKRIGSRAEGYTIADHSMAGTPAEWGAEVVRAYRTHLADRVLGEDNYGGDMVESTIRSVIKPTDGVRPMGVAYSKVHATRGKKVRAEPVAALYERGLVHHVGAFPELEDEMCLWVPGENMPSPNRLDALVWALTDLMLTAQVGSLAEASALGHIDDYRHPWDFRESPRRRR